MIKHPLLLATPLALTLAACGGSGGHGSSTPAVTTVYTMTNATTGNAVSAYRLTNGALTQLASYPTQGNGTGSAISPLAPAGGNDPLGSQSLIVLTPNKQFLFAVNAASGTITSFRAASDGTLTFAQTVSTNGANPNSIAATNSMVYVSNVNSPSATPAVPGQLSGYTINSDGTLTTIANSTHTLGAVNSLATSLAFSSDGTILLSAERGLSALVTYPVQANGTLGTPTVAPDAHVPFGVAVNGSTIFIANAGDSSASTYNLSGGNLSVDSDGVTNGNKATCWAAFAPDGKHAYTANAGSNNVTTYAVGTGGVATIQQAGVATGGSADGPIDGAVTSDGKFYVQLLGATGKIAVFSIDSTGNLTLGSGTATVISGPGSQGLAIR